MKPQENSSHYGTQFASLGNAEIRLGLVSDNDFSIQASHYTREELAEKKHNYELVPSGYTVVNADAAMSGIGSASCGPQLAEIYQCNDEDTEFSLWIYAKPL